MLFWVVRISFKLFAARWNPHQTRYAICSLFPHEPSIASRGRRPSVKTALHHRDALNELRELVFQKTSVLGGCSRAWRSGLQTEL
jgi:hypothetical protein